MPSSSEDDASDDASSSSQDATPSTIRPPQMVLRRPSQTFMHPTPRLILHTPPLTSPSASQGLFTKKLPISIPHRVTYAEPDENLKKKQRIHGPTVSTHLKRVIVQTPQSSHDATPLLTTSPTDGFPTEWTPKRGNKAEFIPHGYAQRLSEWLVAEDAPNRVALPDERDGLEMSVVVRGKPVRSSADVLVVETADAAKLVVLQCPSVHDTGGKLRRSEVDALFSRVLDQAHIILCSPIMRINVGYDVYIANRWRIAST